MGMHYADIIGYLTGCGDLELMEINGKAGQKLQCQIQDLKYVSFQFLKRCVHTFYRFTIHNIILNVTFNRSNELQCTFWGDYAKQINDYVSNDENSAKSKIVIVVQYGRYKVWRGNSNWSLPNYFLNAIKFFGPILMLCCCLDVTDKKSVQNGYFGTRLFINTLLPEIKEFQHKYVIHVTHICLLNRIW